MFLIGFRSFLFFREVDFSTLAPLGPSTLELAPLWITLPLRVVMTSEARDGVGGDVAGVLYGCGALCCLR